MAYAKVVYSSGHGKYLPGACANGYKEHVIAEKLVNKLYSYHKKVGIAYKFHDNYSKSVSANISKIVKYHNSKARNLDVSVHLNAGGGTGTEVLYYSNDQKSLASKVSKAIAKELGVKDRGAKRRTDLGFLKGTKKPAILIEVCFIDNKDDMAKLMKNLDGVAEAIVESITGKQIPKAKTTTVKYHTVVEGDTLYSLAKKYGTTVAKLKEWNNLKSNTLTIGKKLIVKK